MEIPSERDGKMMRLQGPPRFLNCVPGSFLVTSTSLMFPVRVGLAGGDPCGDLNPAVDFHPKPQTHVSPKQQRWAPDPVM